MPPVTNELVPLTPSEKSFLLELYDKRIRFLFVTYIILMAIAFALSHRGIDYYVRYSGKIHHWESENDSHFISRFGMWMINIAFLETCLVSTGLFFFFKRAYPLKKDADSGVKEKVPYKIVEKKYFPITEQYYFTTDDYKYLQHEVDGDTFNKLNEGDYFYIYRAVRSKFVFEESGRYTIL